MVQADHSSSALLVLRLTCGVALAAHGCQRLRRRLAQLVANPIWLRRAMTRHVCASLCVKASWACADMCRNGLFIAAAQHAALKAPEIKQLESGYCDAA